MKKRHLVIISYYRPEENMAASVRLQRLVEAFSQWDWQVDVVAPSKKREPRGKLGQWISFFSQISRLTFRAYRLRRRASLYYISTPPHGLILTAIALKLLTKTPMALEERDLLSINPLANFKLIRCHPVSQAMEHWLLKKVQWLVFATEGLKESVLNRWPDLAGQKILVIWNGYWKKDYDFLPATAARDSSSPITLVHLGNFYGSRNPSPLLPALFETRRLLGRKSLDGQFKFLFIGQWASPQDQQAFLAQAEKMDLHRLFEFRPLLPRKQALQILAESDVAIVVTHTSGSEVAVPAKLYEYVALGMPILAVTHDPLVSDIINNYQVGWCVPHEEPARLGRLLASWVQNPQELQTRRKSRFEVTDLDAHKQITKLYDAFTSGIS